MPLHVPLVCVSCPLPFPPRTSLALSVQTKPAGVRASAAPRRPVGHAALPHGKSSPFFVLFETLNVFTLVLSRPQN